ncbi:hypothetical protein GCM10010468_76160 [Actinocorallia longicatena]|uniref:Uncharacterized protein n=1 Tax=Actinocorallia longicatena TaxID=111803 RepID=A0ABP6QPF6_9ACTN
MQQVRLVGQERRGARLAEQAGQVTAGGHHLKPPLLHLCQGRDEQGSLGPLATPADQPQTAGAGEVDPDRKPVTVPERHPHRPQPVGLINHRKRHGGGISNRLNGNHGCLGWG